MLIPELVCIRTPVPPPVAVVFKLPVTVTPVLVVASFSTSENPEPQFLLVKLKGTCAPQFLLMVRPGLVQGTPRVYSGAGG